MLRGDVAQALGVCHSVHMLNSVVSRLEVIEPWSSPTVRVTDSALGGVPARVFQPVGGGATLRRGVLYFHGGGWALGSGRMRSYDLLCRRMAEELDTVVVSVDYRLAPDAVFPDQYHDALAASRAFLSPEVLQRYGVNPARVGVSGDSSGGNLAAAVAQRVHTCKRTHMQTHTLTHKQSHTITFFFWTQISADDSMSVKFSIQALIYPVLQALDLNTPSYQQNHNVPILHRHLMARFWLIYLGADPSLLPHLLSSPSSLLHPSIPPSIRSHLNWTSLLAAKHQKHYRPVGMETGSREVTWIVPGLVDVRAAPLLAEQGILGRTPRAYVMTCEFDVLRDDGLMYARRLQDAGVTVTSVHYDDGFHGCMVFSFWPFLSSVGQRSLDNYIQWLDHNL
ncbi:neutral cholesterol ester hydrolase 1-like isoform X3 [Salvelinus fontinalis]|uniref:neutral cholesterol ester hydrolase 1-like isoform X3 n=1 Tax=Salvelinus fontinalis TaxID=8038 RepID=UPI002484EAD1|nr:neutral cholesterol ester hydrolase 1-like isoform X3 [Salvelinus fontinalis]